jgi:hypothetical protein
LKDEGEIKKKVSVYEAPGEGVEYNLLKSQED